ncbi:MAG: histidine kinase [Bacteroidota bacterium]|nr:histidine kinase [Bacteroidota bacterium]
MPHSILIQILLIVCSTILLALALLLLSFYKRLYSGVRQLWLRRNLAVLTVAIVFMAAFLGLMSQDLATSVGKQGFWGRLLKELVQIIIIVLFVFNSVWLIIRTRRVQNMSFIKHHAVVIASIVVSAIIIYTILNYVGHGMKFENLHGALIYAYFNGVATGLIYTAVNYVELDRKRKLNEKELEVTRLMALKTKAELDALHSKINPHFLYNALNSIADLSVTDGKKARKMTIALADLFRYSINYSDHNYSTVKEEVEMAEVYLQIEKIRFEDKLNYSIRVSEDVNHYLVPRFVLQPVVENAVKHGLKATGRMTEINIEAKNNNGSFELNVADNGPAFPDELIPGYGVKSIYDKLDLLFPGQYEIYFSNHPGKQVSIHIHKLMKNEPGV